MVISVSILCMVLVIIMKLGFKLSSNKMVLPTISMIMLITMLSVGMVEDSLSSVFYIDKVCLLLTMVTLWLCSSIFQMKDSESYSMLVLLLGLLSVLFFSVSSWLLVFTFFELSLLPIFYGIISGGEQPERLRASKYLMLYTVIASVPLFLCISSMFQTGVTYTFDYKYLNGEKMISTMSSLGLMVAFLVKMPLFLTHSWLPKAHVESPLWGSMFLAGVLLKFGSYGLIRVLPLVNFGVWVNCLLSLSLVGAFLSAIQAMTSSDLKVVVAYSSVSHMNASLSGMLMMKCLSSKSFMMVSVSHALSASLLFYMVTMAYKMVGSRSMIVCKSILFLIPSMVLFMFMAWSMNVGVPPSFSFLAELYTSVCIGSVSMTFVGVLLLSIFVNSVYSMLIFGVLSHGLMSLSMSSKITWTVSNMFTASWMIIPSVFLFVYVELVLI
uniref:NADH-ubiquinone oxidoreductase chain 4 n=1 Tax=Haematopinus suis TaxID=511927 RepID=R9ZPL0_9NEOP|nr:NADH dehydrogenase subunit 4 [Haematopinus suis]